MKPSVPPQKLLWLDLEMTGLRPATDKITEIAAIVTDFDLKEIAIYESGVKHPEELLRALTGESVWHSTQPEYTETMIKDSLSGKPESVVQAELLRFIEEHYGLTRRPEEFPHFPGSLEAKGEVYLAGNSISADRTFIDAQWPDVARVLHYRMIDVSSFKVWLQGSEGIAKFEKKMAHRALDDIRESIAEMQYYVNHLKNERT